MKPFLVVGHKGGRFWIHCQAETESEAKDRAKVAALQHTAKHNHFRYTICKVGDTYGGEDLILKDLSKPSKSMWGDTP